MSVPFRSGWYDDRGGERRPYPSSPRLNIRCCNVRCVPEYAGKIPNGTLSTRCRRGRPGAPGLPRHIRHTSRPGRRGMLRKQKGLEWGGLDQSTALFDFVVRSHRMASGSKPHEILNFSGATASLLVAAPAFAHALKLHLWGNPMCRSVTCYGCRNSLCMALRQSHRRSP